jgi:ABC-type transport system substrate-binding protein
MRASRILLLALTVLVFAACSGPEEPSLTAPADSAAPSTTGENEPDTLAFEDPVDELEPITLRISLPRMSFVAPHVVDETDSVQVLVTDLLTDGLTDRDPYTGEVGPGLADSWSISEDRLTWTFLLGERTFSTGAPIVADDVVASLNRVAQQGVQSLSGVNLSVIDGYDEVSIGDATAMTGVTALDASSIAITLTEPFEPLPELLAGVAFGVFPVDIDTTGALPLSSSRSFTPVAMWDEGFRVNAEGRDGIISAVELWVDPDGSLMADGEVDMALGLGDDDVQPGFNSSWAQRSADAFFALNHDVPPFDDPVVRRALLRAIDQSAIRDEFFPTAGVMRGFVPQSVPGGSPDACGDYCDTILRRARGAVRDTGAGDVPFTVDFFVDEADDSEQALAESLVDALRGVGFNATARAHSVEEYGARIAAGDMAMFRFGSVSTALIADADLAAMFHTDGRDNVTNTSIPEFDALIAEARATSDSAARAAIYAEAEALLFSEGVVVPLVEFRERIVLGERVESAGLEPDGSLDLGSVVFAGQEE